MKRFKFRFEKILSYRHHLERQKQQELAETQNLVQEQLRKISGIQNDRSLNQRKARHHMIGSIKPGRLSGYSRYYLKLKQMELTGREMLQQFATEVEKRRQALVAATRQKRIYEKLKERDLEKYTYEFNLMLQKENDEVGQKVFLRNR
jgi:flagellar FliJ protein